MTTQVLTADALNRATLARQLLLDRSDLTAFEAVEHLVGLQGQAPDAPYVGLWTRLSDFEPAELAGSLTDRSLVRSWLMRATVHLVSARDYLALYPVVRVVMERSFLALQFARNLAGLDIDSVTKAGVELLAEQPRTRAQIGPLLAQRWPDHNPTSLAYAISYLVPVVQVPPRGIWGRSGPAALAPAESWLGAALHDRGTLDDLVLRYLGAFGPASVKDAQAWSGLTRLAEVFERLRPGLLTFRDVHGVELFDLPEAPRPDPETVAPPRFLPEYDNVLLGYADRTRVIPDRRRVPLPPGNGARRGTLLVDGRFRATWLITLNDRATLSIDSAERLPDEAAIVAEGERLLRFVAPELTDQVVHFTS